jgi:hypothetical protein
MRSRIGTGALPSALAAAAACAPEAREGGPLEPAFSNGGIESATGSGHYVAGDQIRTLAFSAVRHADRTVSGEYQINVHAAGLSFHVTVECMLTAGNMAWIGGHVDSSSDPAVVIPGTVSYFWMVDNGEGAGAPADIVSVARINDVDESLVAFCTEGPTILPPREIVHGNVQVTSAS